MGDWKHSLTLSLRQDIIGLTRIIKEISKTVPETGITSWFSPTKIHTDIINEKTEFGKSYVNYLELIIDKLYTIFNLLLTFFEANVLPSTKFNLSRNVCRPKKMTLSSSAEFLWDFISGLKITTVFTKKSDRNTTSVDKVVQTDTFGLSRCDSCTVAIKSIKHISALIETSRANSHTKIARENLQNKMFESTLVSCMNQLGASVEADVKCMARDNALLEELCIKQKDELQELCNSQNLLTEDLKDAERKYDVLKMQHDEYVIRNEELGKERDYLIANELGLEQKMLLQQHEIQSIARNADELRNTIAKLDDQNAELNKEIQEKEGEIEGLTASITTLEEEKFGLMDTLDIATINYEEKLAEQNAYVAGIKTFEDDTKAQIEEFEVLMGMISDNQKKVDDRIARCEDTVTNKVERFRVVLNNVEQVATEVASKQKEVAKVDKIWKELKNNKDEKTMIVKGNPLDDMKRQIEVNNMNIKQMEAENCVLLRTVDKLKGMI